MRHLHVLCPCFCWMPTVTSPQTTWPEPIGKYSNKKPTFHGQCLGEPLRDHHLRAANTYFLVGATFFGPFSNTQIDFACLPAAVHVHRCCALHHDGDRLQLAAAPGRRDHRSIQWVFQHQLTYGMHEKGKITNGTRTSLHRASEGLSPKSTSRWEHDREALRARCVSFFCMPSASRKPASESDCGGFTWEHSEQIGPLSFWRKSQLSRFAEMVSEVLESGRLRVKQKQAGGSDWSCRTRCASHKCRHRPWSKPVRMSG